MKQPKRDITKEIKTFPFKLSNLDAVDMEMLLGNEINKLLGNNPDLRGKLDGVLICSSSEDEVGIGKLLVYPFKDILELGRDGEDELYVEVQTTEGTQLDLIYDFKVIIG